MEACSSLKAMTDGLSRPPSRSLKPGSYNGDGIPPWGLGQSRKWPTGSHLRTFGASLGMSAATLLALPVLPLQPAFTGRDFRIENPDNWEWVRAARRGMPDDHESPP